MWVLPVIRTTNYTSEGHLVASDDYKYQPVTMEIEGTEYTFIVNQNGSIQHSNVEYKEDGDVLINAKKRKMTTMVQKYNVGFVTDGWAKYAIDPETEDNVEFYVDFLDPTSVMAISGSIALTPDHPTLMNAIAE